MEIINTTALININATFFAQMLTFLIFVFIFNRVMLRPLYDIIQRRTDHIESIKSEISDANQTLSDFASDLEMRKHKIRDEAFKINEEQEEAVSHEAAEMLSAARREIISIKESAEKDVARQLKEAQKFFEEEIQTISAVMMEQVLGRKINQ